MRFSLFLCQLCAGVALLKCVCVFFPSQNGLPDTQAKFHILFLFFSASMFSVSLASLFIYHCWLVCKNRSTLGRWRPPRPHACLCVFWVLTQCLQSLSWTPALCFLGICLLCLHSIVFALMMKDAVCLFSPLLHLSPFSSAHCLDEPLWAAVRQRSFPLCVHSGTLCPCAWRRVDYPEEYVTV